VASGPERMTVAEVDALLYLPQRTRRDLERALRMPALSEGWKESFRELLERESGPRTSGPGAEAPPAWPGFRALRVRSLEPESAEVISISPEPTDPEPAPPGAPGRFLAVRLRAQLEAPSITRNYSLSGPQTAGSYRISVRHEPQGVASGFLHSVLQPGDLLDVAPRGTFILSRASVPWS